MKKSTILLYVDKISLWEMLDMEDRGKVITSLIHYQREQECDIEFGMAANMLFTICKQQIDRDNEEYAQRCEKNRKNGAKGGRPQETHESQEKRTVLSESESIAVKPKKPDMDTVQYPDTKQDTEHDITESKMLLGPYGNVHLNSEEMDKLKTEFADWEERIDKLSGYMESTGKTYKNHLATIRNWAKMDKQREIKNDFQNRNIYSRSGADEISQKNNFIERKYEDDFLNQLFYIET